MWGACPVFSRPKYFNFRSVWGILMTAILFDWVPAIGAQAPILTAPADIPRYELNIARVPLNSALKDLAIQTGLQIARLSDAGASGGLVGPLSGRFSVSEALDRLLAG